MDGYKNARFSARYRTVQFQRVDCPIESSNQSDLFCRKGGCVNLVAYLRRQFAYNEWANREVLTAIRSQGSHEDERSLRYMAHILSAEKLWLERLRQQPQSMPVWPDPDLAQCEALAAEMRQLWGEYFNSLDEDSLAQSITYKNSKGEPWSSTVQDVLTHVVMHSAYHRGQIASHMRASGHTPAYTDFIHAVRQGLIK
jgi:uncharacterized damage-inducible protein DinB